MPKPKELVELDVQFQYATAMAIQVSDGEDFNPRITWVPKKFLESWDEADEPSAGDAIVIEIPQWLAEEKELV